MRFRSRAMAWRVRVIWVIPARWGRLMARFRTVAMTCGPLSAWPVFASSAQAVSRSQWTEFNAPLAAGDAGQVCGDGAVFGQAG